LCPVGGRLESEFNIKFYQKKKKKTTEPSSLKGPKIGVGTAPQGRGPKKPATRKSTEPKKRWTSSWGECFNPKNLIKRGATSKKASLAAKFPTVYPLKGGGAYLFIERKGGKRPGEFWKTYARDGKRDELFRKKRLSAIDTP